MNKLSVYLQPSLAITSIHPDILRLILSKECSVDGWSFLLQRLPSLDKDEAFHVVNTITSGSLSDLVQTIFHDYFTNDQLFSEPNLIFIKW